MADRHPGGNGIDHKPSSLDGLPHDFNGWGPQTPDPDAPRGDDRILMPEDALTWQGEADDHTHHVWRFDGRRRHNHH
jgi:hypothetical protein